MLLLPSHLMSCRGLDPGFLPHGIPPLETDKRLSNRLRWGHGLSCHYGPWVSLCLWYFSPFFYQRTSGICRCHASSGSGQGIGLQYLPSPLVFPKAMDLRDSHNSHSTRIFGPLPTCFSPLGLSATCVLVFPPTSQTNSAIPDFQPHKHSCHPSPRLPVPRCSLTSNPSVFGGIHSISLLSPSAFSSALHILSIYLDANHNTSQTPFKSYGILRHTALADTFRQALWRLQMLRN